MNIKPEKSEKDEFTRYKPFGYLMTLVKLVKMLYSDVYICLIAL